jgi:biopolymer transport protein ExbB
MLLIFSILSSMSAMAQDAATTMQVAPETSFSFNDIILFMQEGGIFMYIIAVVWAAGVAICFERFYKLFFKLDVDGGSFYNEIQRYILSNDLQGAMRICSATTAALPRILKAGLSRAQKGKEQVSGAINAASFEVLPRIDVRMGHLSVIASLCTLFGLLGTIQGLIQTFSLGKAADAAQKEAVLTKGIAVAMNTTFLGLIAAISIIMIHAMLNAKADKIKGEMDEYSHKLLDFLDTKQEA